MKYSTYIFDFDYTLADATEGIVASFNYAFRTMGMDERPTDAIRKTVGLSLAESFRVLGGGDDKAEAERFTELFKIKADEVMAPSAELFPDTIAILTQLKAQGAGTAIVTSKLHYRIDDILGIYEIPHLIDCIIGFDDVAAHKPDPEGILKAVSQLGADISRTLYVGDTLVDARAAMAAGADFAAVTTGTTAAEEFAALPNIAVAASLAELFDKIK